MIDGRRDLIFAGACETKDSSIRNSGPRGAALRGANAGDRNAEDFRSGMCPMSSFARQAVPHGSMAVHPLPGARRSEREAGLMRSPISCEARARRPSPAVPSAWPPPHPSARARVQAPEGGRHTPPCPRRCSPWPKARGRTPNRIAKQCRSHQEFLDLAPGQGFADRAPRDLGGTGVEDAKRT